MWLAGLPKPLQPGEDIPGQWWTLFHSAQLNRLIEQALKANPNLQAAQAALREADENVGAQEGYFYPSVVGGVTGLRERRLTYTRGDPAGISSPYTLLNVGVNVSYTLDVFGGIRRQVEADQGAVGVPAISIGSDLSDADGECGYCGGSGSFATRPDRGDA